MDLVVADQPPESRAGVNWLPCITRMSYLVKSELGYFMVKKLLSATVGLLLVSAGVMAGTSAPASAGEMSTQSVWQCDVGNGWCVSTTARVNLRTGPHIGDGIVITMDQGARFGIECWVWGDPVHGDSIWYKGTHRQSVDIPPISWELGYVSGYYLATGKDPHPYFNNCVDS